jgi:hypothetical protein
VTGAACGHLLVAADDPVANQLGLGAVALRYQAMGYAVFPLARGGKRPHRMLGDEGGVYHAALNPAWSRYWWGLDPAANIGIACGQRSRLVVPDFDVKHGADGWGEFARWLGGLGLGLPPGIPWARTPSGGAHAWLRLPPGRAVSSRNGVLPGVDVKGDGGYVVAAPSMLFMESVSRPGEYGSGQVPVPYEWESGCPCQVPVAPAALLDALESLRGTSAGGGFAGGGRPLPPTDELLVTGLPPGLRNELMYKLACRLWSQLGLDAGAAVEATCYAVWRVTPPGDHPFPWSEVPGRIGSARKFIARDRAAQDAKNRGFLAWMQSGGRSS